MEIIRPALYIVGTPIGNLDDFSPRAKEILSQVDFIAAEDTRVTLKLLNRFEIKKELISYYEHNIRERGELIISRLKSGECAALCSDAGMPAISDPGEDIVKLCAENNIPVHSVPGPSAVITALALSGLPTGRFTFEGFLSTSKKSRTEHLRSLTSEARTMVFYEAPHKLLSTLKDFCSVFGEQRRISICRELTKLYEEVIRTTLKDAVRLYESLPAKGEFVLVVEGACQAEQTPKEDIPVTAEALRQALQDFLAQGKCRNAALKAAAESFGISRNEAYDLLNKEK